VPGSVNVWSYDRAPLPPSGTASGVSRSMVQGGPSTTPSAEKLS
jgi:hypothetical protein